jgi:flagellar biosynthesis protein FlhG
MNGNLKLVPRINPRITRVVCVASGKGGVGKTHTTLNLALALESIGKKVLVIDADFGLANLNIMLGSDPEFTIEDFLYGSMPLEDIMFKVSSNFSLISGGSGISDLAHLSSQQRLAIHEELERVASEYDYLLIDSPAGISPDALFFSAAATEVVVVVTPEPTSLTDAYAVIKILSQEYREREVSVVVNCAPAGGLKQAELVYKRLEKAAFEFLQVKVKYLGTIPVDPLAYECILSRTPLFSRYPNGLASRAIRKVAQKLESDYSFTRTKGGLQFFFERFVEIGAS